jgi:hypothetical protein
VGLPCIRGLPFKNAWVAPPLTRASPRSSLLPWCPPVQNCLRSPGSFLFTLHSSKLTLFHASAHPKSTTKIILSPTRPSTSSTTYDHFKLTRVHTSCIVYESFRSFTQKLRNPEPARLSLLHEDRPARPLFIRPSINPNLETTPCTSRRNHQRSPNWKVGTFHPCVFPARNAHAIPAESGSASPIGKSQQHTFHFSEARLQNHRENSHSVSDKWKVPPSRKQFARGKCKSPKKQAPIHPLARGLWKVLIPISTTWPFECAPLNRMPSTDVQPLLSSSSLFVLASRKIRKNISSQRPPVRAKLRVPRCFLVRYNGARIPWFVAHFSDLSYSGGRHLCRTEDS